MPTFVYNLDDSDDNEPEDGDLAEMDDFDTEEARLSKMTPAEVDKEEQEAFQNVPNSDSMETEKSVSSIHLKETEVKLKMLEMAIGFVRNHGSDVNVFYDEGFSRLEQGRGIYSETLSRDRETALSAAYNRIAEEFNQGVPSTLFLADAEQEE